MEPLITEKLFPEWKTARIMLTTLCNEIVWGYIRFNRITNSCNVGFGIPESVLSFPPEDRPKVLDIIFKVTNDYIPDGLKRMLNQPMSEETREKIRSMLMDNEQRIRSKTGRTAIEELKYQFGLLSPNIHQLWIIKEKNHEYDTNERW